MNVPFNPKQVQERIDTIRAAMKKLTDANQRPGDALLQALGHVGELQVALSERAENAACRLERLTNWIMVLTVVLVTLTVAIAALTIPLALDAYLKIQSHHQAGKTH